MAGLAVNAADLATKSDIARLEEKVDRMADRFDGLHKTIIWAMVALTGIFSVVVALLG